VRDTTDSGSAIASPAGVADRAKLTKGESALLLSALFALAASLASFATL
jgi:hypothetical protein